MGESFVHEYEDDRELRDWLYHDIRARWILARLHRQYGRDKLVALLKGLVQDDKISSRM
jgi:hypothetical protein